MKILFKILLTACCVFGLEKAIRTQTNGFRLEKTRCDSSFSPSWETPPHPLADNVLDQPFFFLGSGVQCYAFLSQDGTTVLKLFKHFHFGPSSKQLAKLPLPSFCENWRNTLLKKRTKRMESIFSSALLAYQELPEQTGVFHLHINPQDKGYPRVILYDKIGIRYAIDLNQTPFLLQKKADLLYSYITDHQEETKGIIDSLFHCITQRTQLGIANNDPKIYSNFGVLDGKVVEIDIGSFVENPYTKKALFSKRELYYETLEFKKWLQGHLPEMSEYFDQKLEQAIRT
jgi:hypothetical protein